MNPEYPVYIISKGRWERRLTAKSLEKLGVPYHIVVEPSEYEKYAAVIENEKILVLPYDFSTYDQGSVPVRNWVWEHSLRLGAKRHWILDDNINGFERLNKNQRWKVTSGTIFKCAEDFVDRYVNVAFAGFEYRQFSGGARRQKPPFRLNTRIYSCILVNNELPFKWRGKYNEDTDICLRALKDQWCTILFHCFLQNKSGTMNDAGGNTDTIYNTGDNRKAFAESLRNQHPGVVKVVYRYGRWHHDVDYTPFKVNRLEKREGLVIPDAVNNYGMKLIEVLGDGG